jgi:phage tail sheath protein FI
MAVQPTYPGVYIQEIPSGVRTLTGVATSIAAFIGYFKRGPMNKAVQIFNFGDFEREFGGLDIQSEASYGIQQFFLNGGTQAFVVRVASGDLQAADVVISDSAAPGGGVLRILAISEGMWGNNIRVRIDHNTPNAGEFNMTVTEYNANNLPVRQEKFLNLSMVETGNNFIEKVINDENSGSSIVRVGPSNGSFGSNAPAVNGSLSGDHRGTGETNETATVAINSSDPAISVSINGFSATAVLNLPGIDTGDEYPLSLIAVALENAIRSAAPTNPQFAGATVNAANGRLQILAGRGEPQSIILFENLSGDTTADDLLLSYETGDEGEGNVQEYTLGNTNPAGAQISGTEGTDGLVPNASALRGIQNSKTGLYALEDVDLFNILCIPILGTASDTSFDAVYSEVLSYCEQKRAFFIIDTPSGIENLQAIRNWHASKGSLIRSKNAAIYFPRIKISDPLNAFRLRSVGASGTVAGLYARTDSNRGVWKAPAGIEASLRNASKLTYVLTDQENGVLNQLGINCLRNLPVYGNICWGARTMEGADALASEWKYVPVRRLALFLEESLFRGLHWVVFEPNDEPLWSQIRLNVGAFMNNLFKQGAFQGTSPREAFLVKCDRETTTQNDINLGIVNILVGFAPLKPAEFVFIKIQQLAGQIQS